MWYGPLHHTLSRQQCHSQSCLLPIYCRFNQCDAPSGRPCHQWPAILLPNVSKISRKRCCWIAWLCQGDVVRKWCNDWALSNPHLGNGWQWFAFGFTNQSQMQLLKCLKVLTWKQRLIPLAIVTMNWTQLRLNHSLHHFHSHPHYHPEWQKSVSWGDNLYLLKALWASVMWQWPLKR